MKNVKRILAMSLMTVVGASVLVGCGNDSSTGGGSSKGKVEVSIFQYKVEQKDAFEKAAKEYEKSHDGVSIDTPSCDFSYSFAAFSKASFCSTLY